MHQEKCSEYLHQASGDFEIAAVAERPIRYSSIQTGFRDARQSCTKENGDRKSVV